MTANTGTPRSDATSAAPDNPPAVEAAALRSTLVEDDLSNFLGTQEWRKGRNVRDGYARGWGLQFGPLREKIARDPLYQAAKQAAAGRTLVSEDNRMNLYLIMRFYLSRIPFGHIIEFGSFKGGNAIFMAFVARHLNPGVRVYSLDTFEGMPPTDKSIDAHDKGNFGAVDLDELRAYTAVLGLPNLEFVKGLFQETAPELIASREPFALAHIDCDIYEAVRYAYEAVRGRIVTGGYLVFDDGNVSSCLGATEVVEELAIRRDGLHSEQIFPQYVFRASHQ